MTHQYQILVMIYLSGVLSRGRITKLAQLLNEERSPHQVSRPFGKVGGLAGAPMVQAFFESGIPFKWRQVPVIMA